jgi:hypothetical protein
MASTDNTVARTLHDLGLAAWFGGSLMGATGVNGAAAVVEDPTQRLRVASIGWARWTPLNLAGIAAHLAGGVVLTGANRGRLAGQQGVAAASAVKTALTVAALAPPPTPACWARSWRGPATSRWRAAPPPIPPPPRMWPVPSGSSRRCSG